MEAVVYNKKGKEVSKISLPDKVFSVKWNADLVHQVVTSMQANARTPVAHAKDRGEISGGGKKPWKQKGTGRARHGSTRSPIWVGGGSAHGPRNEKDYSRKINQKMRVKALNTVLSAKLRDGEIIFIDSFDFSAPKKLRIF
jgi:large subunit ribosomal protein L4